MIKIRTKSTKKAMKRLERLTLELSALVASKSGKNRLKVTAIPNPIKLPFITTVS